MITTRVRPEALTANPNLADAVDALAFELVTRKASKLAKDSARIVVAKVLYSLVYPIFQIDKGEKLTARDLIVISAAHGVNLGMRLSDPVEVQTLVYLIHNDTHVRRSVELGAI